MLLRRELLGKAAAGAAAAVTLSVVRTGSAAPRAGGAPTADPAGVRAGQPVGPPLAGPPPTAPADAPVVSAAPPPWELVSPLVAGAVVAPGWHLADLSPVRGGACVVTLGNARGRAQRIHLCRNDGNPQGLVHTRRVDLVVMNEGYGDLPTEEGLAQAVAAVAHTVAANEATVPAGLLGELVAHTERVRRYAAAEGPLAEGKLR